jgi:sugar/nucleoside kinase (ribokinase family)
MQRDPTVFEAAIASRSFDVICAGEASWNVSRSNAGPGLRFSARGGAVSAARALARSELRVGLATVLRDDTFGRALRDEVAAAGVDVGGVRLTQPTSGLVFVNKIGGARQVVPFREEEEPVAIPPGWSAQVLLLSGMSPVVAHAAALCRAARAARRAGTVVVLDVNARWDLWAGRDSRSIRMVLREADVVWSSAEDLLGLNMDLAAMRAALRPGAVHVASDGLGRVAARGPFGEVAPAPSASDLVRPGTDGGAFATAICIELVRAWVDGGQRGELWARAIRRGYAIATARARAAPRGLT